ncbi:unnamed protein product [Peniophora sp. CBMAI 1063]|nr:unnamed protein product [Peniophora sp. CBMAI 1063]
MSTHATAERWPPDLEAGTPNPSNLGELWNVALQRHEQETGIKLLKSANAKDFPLRPATAEEVLAIFAAQSQSFEAFRARGRKVLQVLKPIVHFICLFIDSGAEAGSDTVPGGKAIFVAISVLLQATKGVSGLYDVVEHLFREMASYLNRVPIYLDSSTTLAPALMNILVKACIQVLEVLAVTTKYCNSSTRGLWGAVSRRTRDYLREFIGGSEVKTALEKLQHLTNAELLAAVAQINTIARDIQPKIRFVVNESVISGLRVWLEPPNAQPRNWEKKRRLDSCAWFFGDNKWESWMAQRNGVYWIYGNAGAGKSVLCSSIIEKLKQDSAFPLVYFYFDFSDNAKQDCRSLAASLVFQLAACSEACQGYLQRQQTTTSPTYDEPPVMLSNLVKLAGYVFIMIDALDECPEQERDRGSARFLRPEADIWVLLSSVTHILSLNDARQHQEDVSAFIASRLDRDEHRWAPDVKDKIRKALITRSNGMFLCVDLQLLRLRDCISIADVEGALDELPSDLNDMYTRILQRSNPSKASVERRRRVFQCVASAQRPLYIAEVIEIYCMNFNSRTPLIPVQDCERFILEKCPGLLNIVDWTNLYGAQHRAVQFIHFSAKEYLTSTDLESTTTPAHRYGFDDYSANLTLAKICLSALQVDIDTPPLSLRAYADCYWAEHVSSRNEDDLGDLLDAFLQIDSPSFARWSGPGSEHGQDTAFHRSVRLNLCHHAERIMAQILSDPSAPNQSLLTIPDQYGRSALHVAASLRHVEMCHLLLSHEALVNSTDRDGDTPVHNAASEGHSDIVRVLLEHPAADGADPTARSRVRNENGQTPLHRAAYRGHVDVCRLLLSHGALVDNSDECGNTPVHFAAQEKEPEIVRLLLAYRAKDAPQVLPAARKLRENLRRHAEQEPKRPWGAILEDFASQLEDHANGSD